MRPGVSTAHALTLMAHPLRVRLAAERVSDDEVAERRALGEALTVREAEGDVVGFAHTTLRVFDTYVRISGQPVAREVLERLRDRNARHRFRLSYRPGRAQGSLPQWLAIIEAIRARDPDAATAALRRHVDSVKEAMVTLAQDSAALARLPARAWRPRVARGCRRVSAAAAGAFEDAFRRSLKSLPRRSRRRRRNLSASAAAPPAPGAR